MQSNLFGYHNTDDGWQRIVDPKVEGRVKVEGRENTFFLAPKAQGKRAGSPPAM